MRAVNLLPLDARYEKKWWSADAVPASPRRILAGGGIVAGGSRALADRRLRSPEEHRRGPEDHTGRARAKGRRRRGRGSHDSRGAGQRSGAPQRLLDDRVRSADLGEGAPRPLARVAAECVPADVDSHLSDSHPQRRRRTPERCRPRSQSPVRRAPNPPSRLCSTASRSCPGSLRVTLQSSTRTRLGRRLVHDQREPDLDGSGGMIDRLTPRSAILLSLVLVVLIGLLGWFALVSPQRAEAASLQQEIDLMEARLDVAEAIKANDEPQERARAAAAAARLRCPKRSPCRSFSGSCRQQPARRAVRINALTPAAAGLLRAPIRPCRSRWPSTDSTSASRTSCSSSAPRPR